MVRILHVTLDKIYEPLQGGGGVARFIHGLSQELCALGADVKVAAKRIDVAGNRYGIIEYSGMKLIKEIRWADVVHTHGPRRPRMAIVAFAAILNGKPFIFSPYAYYDQLPPTRPVRWLIWKFRQLFKKKIYDKIVERFLYTHGFAVSLQNDYWVNYVRDEMRLPVDRVVVLSNCVRQADLPSMPRNRESEMVGEPSILSVGRLDEVKCLDHVIAVLSLPTMERSVFHVVGKGPDRSRLEKLASERGVEDRVIFYGVVDDGEVAVMAASCDVFVLPSRQEGMPTVLIEMLLHGVSVVSSDIPGNRAILEMVGAEGLYPFGDVERLASTILRQASATVSDEVRQRVIERLTWERHAPNFLALYERAALAGR